MVEVGDGAEVKVDDVFTSPKTGAMMKIISLPKDAGQGKVEILRLIGPGMGFRLPHVHLLVDETFRVERGVADFRIGWRRARLGSGEILRVPRYETHAGPLNRSRSELVYVQTLEAARTDGPQRYVKTLAKFLEQGRDRAGDLPPLVAAAVFAGRDQQIFLPAVPQGLQRDALFPLAKKAEQRLERRRVERKTAREERAWRDW